MEELKAIITLISQLGGEAKWAFFVYLGYELLEFILGLGLVTLVTVFAYKLINFGIESTALSRRILTALDRYLLNESEKSRFILYLAENKKFIKEKVLDR